MFRVRRHEQFRPAKHSCRSRRRLLRPVQAGDVSRSISCAIATSAGPSGRARRADRRGSGSSTSAASSRCPGAIRDAAGAALSRPPVPDPTTRTSATAAASSSRSSTIDDGPAARSRHQGLGADAVVARRRRAADAQGRRARGAGDGDARGARRRYVARSFSLIETGEELERGDEPSPTRVGRAGAAVAQPYPHRHVPAAAALSSDDREPRARCSTIRSRTTTRPLAESDNDRAARSSARSRERVARDRRALDGGGLRPRRAQHRQHQHHRRELRLRAVAVPADLRSGFHRRLFRPVGALCVRPPARRAGLEPDRGWPSACCRSATRTSSRRRSTRFWPRSSARCASRCSSGWGFSRSATRRTRSWSPRCSRSSTRPRRPTSSSSSTGAAAALRERAAAQSAGSRTIARRVRRRRSRRMQPAPTPISITRTSRRDEPRTMLIDEMEALWAPIAERDDWAPLQAALGEIEDAAGLCEQSSARRLGAASVVERRRGPGRRPGRAPCIGDGAGRRLPARSSATAAARMRQRSAVKAADLRHVGIADEQVRPARVRLALEDERRRPTSKAKSGRGRAHRVGDEDVVADLLAAAFDAARRCSRCRRGTNSRSGVSRPMLPTSASPVAMPMPTGDLSPASGLERRTRRRR